MPVKKKEIKTEESTEKIEEQTEETENKQVPEDTCIQKPKKPKRELTEKQKENFKKLQAANAVRYAEKKRLKEEALNNKIQEIEVKQEIKNDQDKPIKQVKKEVVEEEEESEEEVVVKKKPVKKKKQKIIIEDSDSSSDNEIIIRRSKGRRKSKAIDIPVPEEQPKPELIVEEKKESKKEEVDLTKKYSAKQILQSLGL